MDPSPDESETSSATADKLKPVQDAEPQVGNTPDPASINTETTAASQATRGPRICGVCNKDVGKYKCPRCTITYCSVACNRIHNVNHPPPTQPVTKQSPPPGTERDTQKDDPYRVLLEHSSEFKRLFQKYPSLETELTRIHEVTLPPRDDGTTGGALPWKVRVPGQAHKEPWSRDVGLRTGAAALRRARTDPGDTGDAVREYCDLVLHLLAASGRDDATAVVRREVAAEEARTVERLLAEEGDRP